MKRPWNIPDLPVYSLVTRHAEQENMNICTYVGAISMQPKLYAIAIYNGTLSLALAEQSNYAVLQLLGADQYRLVKTLGQQSGHTIDKISWLAKRNLLHDFEGFPVLKDNSASLLMRKTGVVQSDGDHVLFIYRVEKSKSLHEDYLTTGLLREKGIIRA